MKYTEFTAEQERALVEFRDQWTQIGLATGASNLEAMTPVITSWYQRLGHAAPIFIRAQSPLQAQYMINVFDQLRDQLYARMRDQLHDQMYDQMYARMYARMRDQMSDQLRDQLRAQLYDQLRAQMYDQLHDQMSNQVRNQMSAQMSNQMQYRSTWFWGCLDSFWIAYYLFPLVHLDSKFYVADLVSRLNEWVTLAKNGFLWYPYEGICFISDRPIRVSFDSQNRLHSADGAAIEFADGWAVYCWHGVRVPEAVILRPETITVERIEAEVNAEVRRVMIDRMGMERYFAEAEMQLVDEQVFVQHTPFGDIAQKMALYRYKSRRGRDDDVYVLACKDATPEGDGTYKDYLLEIDPTQYDGDAGRVVKAAVASTWRRVLPDGTGGEPYLRDWRDYELALES